MRRFYKFYDFGGVFAYYTLHFFLHPQARRARIEFQDVVVIQSSKLLYRHLYGGAQLSK